VAVLEDLRAALRQRLNVPVGDTAAIALKLVKEVYLSVS